MTEKTLDLIDAMDAAARELLKTATAATMDTAGSTEPSQPIDIKSRIAAFEAVTTYLAMKHKIRPDGAKASGIDKYRARINGGAPGGGTSRPPRAGAGGSHLTAVGEDD